MARILFSAILLAPLGAAGLDKPTLFKNGLPFSDYGDGLAQVATTYRAVGAPDMCVEHALSSNGCAETEVEAREVTYGDCETPWILCRCSDANLSMDEIMLKFGFVPPGIRSYVGGLLAVFDPAASAGTSGDFIVFRSDCSTPVFIHESAHSLDQGTNGTPEWRDAIAKSGCVPDDYANSNEAEDFAQVTVVHSYLAKHGSVPSDPSCLKPQLDILNNTPRLALAQSTTKCSPEKRPFVLKASDRAALGKDGSTPTVPASGTGASTASESTGPPRSTATPTPTATSGDSGAAGGSGDGVPENAALKSSVGLSKIIFSTLLLSVAFFSS